MNFLDKVIPWFVGNRTVIIGLVLAIINALAGAGVIPGDVASKSNQVALPLMGATLAAKIERNKNAK